MSKLVDELFKTKHPHIRYAHTGMYKNTRTSSLQVEQSLCG